MSIAFTGHMRQVEQRAGDYSFRLLVIGIVCALGVSRSANADSADASKTVTLSVSGECPNKVAVATELQRAHFTVVANDAPGGALALEVVDERTDFRVSLDGVGQEYTDSARQCAMRARAVVDSTQDAERKRFVRKADGGLALLIPMRGAGHPTGPIAGGNVDLSLGVGFRRWMVGVEARFMIGSDGLGSLDFLFGAGPMFEVKVNRRLRLGASFLVEVLEEIALGEEGGSCCGGEVVELRASASIDLWRNLYLSFRPGYMLEVHADTASNGPLGPNGALDLSLGFGGRF